MNKKLNPVFNAIITVIVTLLILLVVQPLIYFLGWCAGWFAMVTIGDTLIKGINTIFGTGFAKDILPTIGGVLGWVSSFFRITQNKSNK